MSKKKSAGSPEKAKAVEPSRSTVALTVRKSVFRPSMLWWLASALLIVVFLPYLPWLIPDLSGLPQYQIGWDRVQVTPPPPGVPTVIVDEVRAAAKLPERLSLLEPGLAARLAVAFAAHPWIANVEKVEVERQRRITIALIYRRPAALVESRDGYYPVDAEGVLLPPGDFDSDAAAKLPVVKNIKTLPQGAAGEGWGDLTVVCAARVAAALAPEGDIERHWNRLGLAALIAPTPKVAAPVAEDLSFEILTRGGSIVVWGRAPGADSLEPSVEEKLARLSQVVQNQGSLDGPGGPYRIDIRHEVISLQSLSDRRYR